jgi:hypothetical protein
LTNAIAVIEYTYKRVGFPVQTNNFRKIPRDALRVCILSMTTKINEMLVNNNEDKEQYLKLLLTIHQALKMLEKFDNHRT